MSSQVDLVEMYNGMLRYQASIDKRVVALILTAQQMRLSCEGYNSGKADLVNIQWNVQISSYFHQVCLKETMKCNCGSGIPFDVSVA